MSFKEAKHQILHCLTVGNILHAQRGAIDVKNLLVTGQVTETELIAVLARIRGNEYVLERHHSIPNIDVHIVRTSHAGLSW